MAITNQDVKKLKTIFATKDDLKNFATKSDLRISIDNLRDEIYEVMDMKLTTFRNDIFNKLDEVIVEIRDNREEITVLAHQVRRNSKRLDKIELKLAQ